MNRGSCRGSFAIGAVTNGKSPTSGQIRSYAPRVVLSPFKRFKQSTANVFPGKAGSLTIGLHRSIQKANQFYLGNAHAVILTA
jgi:hypothetical protein